MDALNRSAKPDDLDGAKQRVCQGKNNLPYIYPKEGMSQDLWYGLPIAFQEPDTPPLPKSVQKSKFDRDVSSYSGQMDVAHRRPVWQLGRRFNGCFNRDVAKPNVTSLVEARQVVSR